MTDTIARLRIGKLIFETMVDLDSAMKLKKGENMNIAEVIRDNFIYTDQKKGMKASEAELENAFETTDFPTIVEKIVKKGDVEVTQDFRDEEIEKKKRKIIDFLSKNAVDVRTGRPFTPEMIESSIKDAGVKIENVSVESQIKKIIETLKKAIPIKLETKKIKIIIPAQFTGRAYGIVQEYKEKEEWKSNGDLEIIIDIPVGIQTDFYDKINSVTHGSVMSEEIKE